MRATMTPATAYAPASPPLIVTSAVTATNPTQSPNELIVCAARSLEKDGWVMRSLKVAGRVPRSAATSSANDATYLSVAGASPAAGVAAFAGAAASPEPFPAFERVVDRFFVVVRFFVVFAVDRLAAVDFRFAAVPPFLAAARAARAAAFAARASASASGSPGFATW